jgi:hypothetical protein
MLGILVNARGSGSRWKVSDVNKLCQLEEENRQKKQLVAENGVFAIFARFKITGHVNLDGADAVLYPLIIQPIQLRMPSIEMLRIPGGTPLEKVHREIQQVLFSSTAPHTN